MNKNKKVTDHKVYATLIGSAIGDALGYPFEFLRTSINYDFFNQFLVEPSFYKIYQTKKQIIGHPPIAAMFSDDTQMSLRLCAALEEYREGKCGKLTDCILKNFVKMLDDKTTSYRAPGRTCMTAIHSYDKTGLTEEARVKDSKGCGTVMRAHVVPLFYNSKLSECLKVSKIQSLTTHGHEEATVASQVMSGLIYCFINDMSIPETITLLHLHFKTNEIGSEIIRQLSRMSLEKPTIPLMEVKDGVKLPITFYGQGWTAKEALLMGFYAFMDGGGDFKNTMRTAIVHDGDSDTVGAIAGALFGAYYNLQKIPLEFIKRVEGAEYISEIARTIEGVTGYKPRKIDSMVDQLMQETNTRIEEVYAWLRY